MFPSQMLRLKIVQPSSGPLFAWFPRKWYTLKLSNPQVVHIVHVSLANDTPWHYRTLKWSTLSMFPSQMVRLEIIETSSGPLSPCFQSQMVWLKIVEPSSGPCCPCFPRKWYALKLSNPHVVHFVHVSLSNGMPWTYRTLKWSTLSMFPSQMVRLKIVEPSSGPLCACFPRKWYSLKLSNPQVVHFVNVSLANGTP